MGTCYSNNIIEKSQDDYLNRIIEEQLQHVNFNEQSIKVPIKSNKEILKQYKISSILGKGLFSKVLLAKNQKNNKKVALKIINKKSFSSVQVLKKFLIEKEILKRFQHINILKLYGAFQSKNRLYYELEFAEKGNLLEILNSDINFNINDIKLILAQIISALFFLHSKNLIYGDLKIENILLNNQGQIKICDFNLSGTKSILQSTLQGTLQYISPEMIEKKNMSLKSDFWALGVVAYVLYFKKYPFRAQLKEQTLDNIIKKNLNSEFENAPENFKKFLNDCLEIDPEQRIGENISEFEQHIFFENFNWSLISNKSYTYPYIQKIEKEISSLSESSETSEVQELKQQTEFEYIIEEFTYEQSSLSSKNSISKKKQLYQIKIKFLKKQNNQNKNLIQKQQ